MRFAITVTYAQEEGESWEENYDDRAITTVDQASEKGRSLVNYFNSTLRPGEKARRFVSARILADSVAHDWRKVNLVTIVGPGGRTYDKMRCAVCEITGKRLGLVGVKRDSKFRAAKYETCAGSMQNTRAQISGVVVNPTSKPGKFTVKLDGKTAGEIRSVKGGWQYFPKGQKTGGAVFPHFEDCEQSLR